MLLLNENVETLGLQSAADSVCAAARTAPKDKGANSETILTLCDNLLSSDKPELRVLHRR